MTATPPLQELRELAARVEAATEAEQYQTLADAAYAIWGDEADAADKAAFWNRATRFVAMMRAGAFESAALMLIGDEWWSVEREPCGPAYFASVGSDEIRRCATPALALTAAYLRAAQAGEP